MKWNYQIKIALWCLKQQIMCSTRDWFDWCSTRLCVAEGVQKLYHGRRFPRVIPWCTRLYFSEGKDLRLLGFQVPYHCVPTVNLGYRSGIMASATFRGCPLNTALCIRTQDQKNLFTLHFSSSWANHMVFFLEETPGIMVHCMELLSYMWL